MSKKSDGKISAKVIDKVVSGEGAATATGAAVGGYFGSSLVSFNLSLIAISKSYST